MGIVEIFALSLSITDKLMDKIPDYPQRKKEKFYRKMRDYNEALKQDYPDRDDALIDNLRDELFDLQQVFLKEISG